MSSHVYDQDPYHLKLEKGDVSPRVLLTGDPGRVERIADRFDSRRVERENREFRTVTGTYQGSEITVVSTGIGPGNMEIVMVELSQVIEAATFVRLGSCGGIQPGIKVGELVISSAAVRCDDVTDRYAPPEYPAVADARVTTALIELAQTCDLSTHVGITASTSSFYAGQGNIVSPFEGLDNRFMETMGRLNVANVEMEVATMFVMASIWGMKAGAICTVYDDYHKDLIEESQKQVAESIAIDVALGALLRF